MNETGELVEWNDARGFGFVQPTSGDPLFVHISAFIRPLRRPEPGDRLAFSRGKDKYGRTVVTSAKIAGATSRPQPVGPSAERIEGAQLARALRLLGAALIVAALVVLHPPVLIWIYIGMGIVSFIAYWLDKRAADAGRWRTAESTLHGIDLLGGIVGGLLAQAALHHKTAKPGFAALTFAITGASLLFIAGISLWPLIPD